MPRGTVRAARVKEMQCLSPSTVRRARCGACRGALRVLHPAWHVARKPNIDVTFPPDQRVLQYVDFLTHLNDDDTTRVVFERALKEIPRNESREVHTHTHASSHTHAHTHARARVRECPRAHA